MWHWITHHLQLLLLAAVAFWLLRAMLRAPAGAPATGNAVAGLFGALFTLVGFVFKAGWKLLLAVGALLALLLELMPDGSSESEHASQLYEDWDGSKKYPVGVAGTDPRETWHW
jgi:hypothetical protein